MTREEFAKVLATFRPGQRKRMDYETEFHALLRGEGDPEDHDACEAVFGPDSVTWPAVSYYNAGDSYADTLLYDHDKGVAIRMSIGDWLERHPECG